MAGARCQVPGGRWQVAGMSQCLPTCPGAAVPWSIIPGRGATLRQGLVVEVQVQVGVQVEEQVGVLVEEQVGVLVEEPTCPGR